MLFSFDAVSLALASEVEYPGPELASATLASLRCTPGEPARLFRARDFKSYDSSLYVVMYQRYTEIRELACALGVQLLYV